MNSASPEDREVEASRPVDRGSVHLIACIAISLVLHVLMIFSMRAADFGPVGTVTQRPIEVRLPVRQATPEVVIVESRLQRPKADVGKPAANSTPTERLRDRADDLRGLDRPNERRPEVPLLPSPLAAPLAFNESIYIRSNQLSVRPVRIGEILIPYPEGVEWRGISKAILSLFIDEEGAVVRVNVDKSELPFQFQEAATDVFARARFRPGEIDGRPVKSRISIEVTFDSDAARSGTAESTAR